MTEPGPSRRIHVDPIEQPERLPEPTEAPAQPETPEREREKVPA